MGNSVDLLQHSLMSDINVWPIMRRSGECVESDGALVRGVSAYNGIKRIWSSNPLFVNGGN